jgi:ribonuclease D
MLDDVRWVERTDELEEQIAAIGRGPLAVDTEADSLHHYRDKVCLVQLSFGGADVLVDPLAGVDMEPLRDVLASPDVPKLLHGADYDLRILHRDCGLEIRGLFDTMIAARLVGEKAFGLAALLAKYLDVTLEKKFQRADWSLRPLPEDMARYAVMDTRYLEALVDRLRSRLEELGRVAWAEEEFRRLEEVRWQSAKKSEEPWARVKKTRDLDRWQLAFVREIANLREAIAERRDVPPFRVLRDEVIVALARRSPTSRDALRQISGLPRSFHGESGARRLLDAVRRGLDVAEADLPRVQKRGGRRREPEFEQRVRALGKRRDAVAERLELEPSVIAPRAILELALDRADRGESPLDTPEINRWRAELLEPCLAAAG